jgi:hypothetical protein
VVVDKVSRNAANRARDVPDASAPPPSADSAGSQPSPLQQMTSVGDSHGGGSTLSSNGVNGGGGGGAGSVSG